MAYARQLNLHVIDRDLEIHYTPTLIISGEERILVDCGTPGLLKQLSNALEMEQFKVSDLTKVIITHPDHDHYGSLAELKKAYPQIKVITSAFDAPYIEGLKKSLRLEQIESLYSFLPPDRKEKADSFMRYMASFEPVKVDVLANDGDCVDAAGEVVIIATPGHMPGHISVYVKGDKTLVSGDALVSTDGVLQLANPLYTINLEMARESARKLITLDIDRVICYHGGLVEGDIKAALEGICESNVEEET